MRAYQICNRCIMDTSDPNIVFNNDGTCNHCIHAINRMNKLFLDEKNNNKNLNSLFEKIRTESHSRRYDCIMGLSGGIDSSYMALLAKDHGLRILGLHIDAGFNDPVSEKNLIKLVNHCKIDYKVINVDRNVMADLQRAYIRSEVINMDVPQDHVFLSALYKYAYDNKIKYCLHGRNGATENISYGIPSNSFRDLKNLRGIHKAFGECDLKKYPQFSFFDEYFKYGLFGKLKYIYPLEVIKFEHNMAWERLTSEVGFEYYGAKHCESIFTRLYQNYIMPHKFGLDKRRAHLSDLIISGQISRDEALSIIGNSEYKSQELLEKDIEYVLEFINMERAEFDQIISNKSFSDYKKFGSDEYLYKFKDILKRVLLFLK